MTQIIELIERRHWVLPKKWSFILYDNAFIWDTETDKELNLANLYEIAKKRFNVPVVLLRAANSAKERSNQRKLAMVTFADSTID